MITKKTIQKQIEVLENYILGYREQIKHVCDAAEERGCLVYKYGDFCSVFYKDYTPAAIITSDLDRLHGRIIGLQLAINQLKELL